jgi:two-component system, NarL family, capsular synthesis sensor histidine kinase RcsC
MEASAKALVVDDDGVLRSIVAKMLSVLGYEVSSADNGEKGLRIFLRNKFDLVLSDYEMPGMDGFALAHSIKCSSPDTPVVLMTGAAREAVLSRKGTSVDRVLFKPFTLAEMGAALSSIA